VRDNGRGFSPDTAPGPEQGHFGLLGIRGRLKEFSGSFNIESALGKGTKATVRLTIERDSYETENQNPPR
jgi:signal transduction histidine kinase